MSKNAKDLYLCIAKAKGERMSNNGKKIVKVIGYTFVLVAAQVAASIAEGKLSQTMNEPKKTN